LRTYTWGLHKEIDIGTEKIKPAVAMPHI